MPGSPGAKVLTVVDDEFRRTRDDRGSENTLTLMSFLTSENWKVAFHWTQNESFL